MGGIGGTCLKPHSPSTVRVAYPVCVQVYLCAGQLGFRRQVSLARELSVCRRLSVRASTCEEEREAPCLGKGKRRVPDTSGIAAGTGLSLKA